MNLFTKTFVAATTEGVSLWVGIFWAIVGASILGFVIVKLFTEFLRYRGQSAASEGEATGEGAASEKDEKPKKQGQKKSKGKPK